MILPCLSFPSYRMVPSCPADNFLVLYRDWALRVRENTLYWSALCFLLKVHTLSHEHFQLETANRNFRHLLAFAFHFRLCMRWGIHKTISLLVLTAPEALLSLWKFLPGTQSSDEDNLDRVTSHLFPRMKILDKSVLITLHLLWCVSVYQALGMHPMMRSFSNSMI